MRRVRPTGDDSGAGLVEYALLLALIVVVCAGGLTYLGGRTGDSIGDVRVTTALSGDSTTSTTEATTTTKAPTTTTTKAPTTTTTKATTTTTKPPKPTTTTTTKPCKKKCED